LGINSQMKDHLFYCKSKDFISNFSLVNVAVHKFIPLMVCQLKWFWLGSRGCLKGQMQCFSMQVGMNKCFLLNPEKSFAQIRLVVFKKNAHFSSKKNGVTEPKAKLL